MYKKSTPYEYYVIHETTVPLELAEKKLQIVNENITNVGGKQIVTLTYNQVLQRGGARNWNGREYDLQGIVRSIEQNPLIQYDLKMGTWTAEYGHPIIEKGQNELARQMTIFPPNACNTIKKWWVEGDLIMGTCETLAGGYGDILRDRILSKYPAMASSRAIGGVDAKGKVLPGYTLITYDTVIRPSHKEAYGVPGTEKANVFALPTGNTFNESAIVIDVRNNESFKNFVLTESSEKINMLCEALNLNYDTLTIDGNDIRIQRITESAVDTIIIPLKKVISAEYHNLFK